MHAIRQHAFGGPEELRFEVMPDLVPADGEVRIAVSTAGVHLLDTAIRRGEAPPRAIPALPMTPGREAAGIIDQVGAGVSPDLLGRRAVVDLGVASGGYAEQAVAPAASLHLLPDTVTDVAAVAMVGTGRTTMAILELAQLRSDDVAIITGAAGGVGTLLIQAAVAAGARVVAVASGADKTALVASLGATPVDGSDPEWIKAARAAAGDGATILLDGVGGATGSALLDTIRVGGRVVMFGTAAGSAIQLTADDVYARGITVCAAVGARLLLRPDGLRPLESRALDALAQGRLRPIVGSIFDLADAAAAHRAVESRSSLGKTVLTT